MPTTIDQSRDASTASSRPTRPGSSSSAFQEAVDFGLPFDLESEYVRSIELDAQRASAERSPMRPFPFGRSIPTACDGSVCAGQRTEWRRAGQVAIDSYEPKKRASDIQLAAHDRSGWLTATIRIKYSDRSIDFTYRTQLTEPVLPIDLSPALAFVAALHVPNVLSVKLAEPAVTLVDGLPIDAQPIIQAAQRKVIDDLAGLQHASGVHFELPDSFFQQDLREIDEGSRLLAGEAVPMRWPSVTIHLRPEGDEPGAVREAAASDRTVSLVTENEVAVEVAGHILNLGKGNAGLIQR